MPTLKLIIHPKSPRASGFSFNDFVLRPIFWQHPSFGYKPKAKCHNINSPNICFDYESWHPWEMLNIQNENWDIKCNLN